MKKNEREMREGLRFNPETKQAEDQLARLVSDTTDKALAEALAAATTEDRMLEAEDAILGRLNVSGDETEQGRTANAVQQIEAFMSAQLGRAWTYRDLDYRPDYLTSLDT